MNSLFCFAVKLSLSQAMRFITFTLPILSFIPLEDSEWLCGVSCQLGLNHSPSILQQSGTRKMEVQYTGGKRKPIPVLLHTAIRRDFPSSLWCAKWKRNFSSSSTQNSLMMRPPLLARINTYSHNQELNLPETVSL